MLYKKLQKIWHYIKCVIICKQEIGYGSKRKFRKFGKNSIIARPYLQLSGCRNIEIGNGTTILNNSRLSVYGNDSNKANITIGNNSYIGFGFSALASSKANITIEDNVLFASNVIVTNENHGMDPESTVPYMDQELTANDVFIGEGSWIGEKVCILSGVSIGKKCIIGAGSVVTKSIPSYSIAAGNPAKVLKVYNFESKRWEKYNEENGEK